MHVSDRPVRRRVRRSLLVAAVISAAVVNAANAQSGVTRALIRTGDPLLPGSPVETLSSFFMYGIAANGQIVYQATVGNNQAGPGGAQAIMRAGGTSPREMLLRSNQTLPGGGTYGSINHLMISPNGRVGLASQLSGTTATEGLFYLDTGSVQEVRRQGQTLFSGLTYVSMSLSARTDLGAYTTVTLSGSGVTAANDAALVYFSGTSVAAFVREGASAFGGTWGGNFGFPAANTAGQVFFNNTLNGVTNPSRLFRFSPSSLATEEMVSAGAAVPGSGTLGTSLNAFAPNNVGQVSLYSNLAGTAGGSTDNEGIYRAAPGELLQIARKGQAAPGGGTLTSIGTSTDINDSGRVLFLATQSGSTGGQFDGNNLFTGTGGTLTRVLRAGQVNPATGNAVVSVFPIALNNAGVVLASANVLLPGESSARQASLLTDGTDIVEVIIGGITQVGSATVAGSYGNGGRNRLLADGRVISWVVLQGGLGEAIAEFTPTLRFRTTFSSSWDTATNWTLSLRPSDVHPVRIDPATSLTVSGPASATTIKSLTLGGGGGIATLNMNGGTISTADGTFISPTGVVSGSGQFGGTVDNAGTLTPTSLTFADGLSNFGTLRGTTFGGTLTGAIHNTEFGQIRSNAGESLRVLGAQVVNRGRIEALGNATSQAVLNFASGVNNIAGLGLITGRNAELNFGTGLTNAGSLALTASFNDVFGDITNIPTGMISVTGGAHTTFYDDVIQNGTLRVVRSGSTTSVAVFLGSFSGSGGATGGGDLFFEGDLRPGNSPAFVTFDANVSLGSGATTLIELAGTGTHQYDRISVTGVLNLAGTLDVQFIDGYLPSGGAPVSFRILEAGALVGDFTQILLPTAGDRQWTLLRDANSLTLSSFNVIPEPGILAPLAALALTLRRSR